MREAGSLVLRDDLPQRTRAQLEPLEPLQGWIQLWGTPGGCPEAGDWLELGGSFVSGRDSLDFGVARPLPVHLLQRARAQLESLEPLQGWNILYSTPGQHP